jgi:high-affinity iron transporter
MYGTALIVFREVLEIAIILSVILAATKSIASKKRNNSILLGLALGVAGSVLVAVFASQISDLAQGMGQEIFNGIILSLAALMIGWTVIWMRGHAKEIVAKLKNLGSAISVGGAPMYALTVAIAVATLREGSEIVLFTYANILSGVSWFEVLSGATIGFAGGAIVGTMIYMGLIKISTKYIFQVTTWMLILLAAGLAAKAAEYFVSGGLIEMATNVVWSTSNILPQDSFVGEILAILVGYTAEPMGIQLVFYGATLLTLGFIIYIQDKSKKLALSK